jgi:hypothetical protein
MGERDPHNADGVVNSPYPPRTAFDCSNIPHGGLVLDTHVNKVFVRAIALASFQLPGKTGEVFEYHRRKLSVTYFPVEGDSPEVAEQKQARLAGNATPAPPAEKIQKSHPQSCAPNI